MVNPSPKRAGFPCVRWRDLLCGMLRMGAVERLAHELEHQSRVQPQMMLVLCSAVGLALLLIVSSVCCCCCDASGEVKQVWW